MIKLLRRLSLKRLLHDRKYFLVFSGVLLSTLFAGGAAFAFVTLPVRSQPAAYQGTSHTHAAANNKPLQPSVASENQEENKTTGTDQQITSSSTRSNEPAATPTQTTNPSPRRAPTPPKTNTPVTPNPYCPAPNFDLSVTRAANSYDLYVTILPAIGDPSSTPACGGVNYSTPIVTHPSNGYFCSGLTYPTGNTSWGIACSVYGNTPYGVYTFTIAVTGTNGYGVAATRTVKHTFNYQPE